MHDDEARAAGPPAGGPGPRRVTALAVAGAVVAAGAGAALFGAGVVVLLATSIPDETRAGAAARAIPVPSERPLAPELEGSLVAVSGPARAAAPVGDPDLLAPGPWLAVERRAERWEGGAWVPVPRFAGLDDRRLAPAAFHADRVEVGAVTVALEPGEAEDDAVPGAEPLALDPPVRLLAGRAEGGWLLLGAGSLAAPAPGDARVAFRVVRSGATATYFGVARGGGVVPYHVTDGMSSGEVLHGPFVGAREAALAALGPDERVAAAGARRADQGKGLALLALGLLATGWAATVARPEVRRRRLLAGLVVAVALGGVLVAALDRDPPPRPRPRPHPAGPIFLGCPGSLALLGLLEASLWFALRPPTRRRPALAE